MTRTRHTARKSTDRLPVGQLAPQNVAQPQESQPDVPQEASPEEEPFKIYMINHQLPFKPMQITSSTSNQVIRMAKNNFQTQEGSKKSTRFLNTKYHTPPEPKANQTKRQIQPKTSTPPEDKYRPLKQQGKSKHI
jgi:hypothetical protein